MSTVATAVATAGRFQKLFVGNLPWTVGHQVNLAVTVTVPPVLELTACRVPHPHIAGVASVFPRVRSRRIGQRCVRPADGLLEGFRFRDLQPQVGAQHHRGQVQAHAGGPHAERAPHKLGHPLSKAIQ